MASVTHNKTVVESFVRVCIIYWPKFVIDDITKLLVPYCVGCMK